MKPDEKSCIDKWRELLARFSVLIENNPEPQKIQKELLELKDDVRCSGVLTFRQTDSLVARIDNFLCNRWGKTKPPHLIFKAS